MVAQLREEVGHLTAFTQLITPTLLKADEGKYDPYLAIANQSLYRLLRLTGNVEFTTAPGAENPPRMVGVDLADLTVKLCDEVASLATVAQRTFLFETDCGTLLTTGDSALLRRLLLNLISNALRSAGEGGEAGLRMTHTPERVLFTIWDSGEGMSFEPAPQHPFPKVDGIGLGLEVARQITLLHDGTLLFDQQEGKGGRATVALPIRLPEGSTVLRNTFDPIGGFSPVLVELSSILPSSAFSPHDLA